MAAKMTLDELEVSLRSAGAVVNPKIRRRMNSLARDIEAEMKRLVPVDTGRLRDSIRIKSGLMTWTIGTESVPYAIYVERGTSRMRAQPFIRPAFEKYLPEVAKGVAKDGARFWEKSNG